MSRRLLVDTFVGIPARRLPPGCHHPGPRRSSKVGGDNVKGTEFIGESGPRTREFSAGGAARMALLASER